MKDNKKLIAVRLDPDDLNTIDVLTTCNRELTISSIIRSALQEYFSVHKDMILESMLRLADDFNYNQPPFTDTDKKTVTENIRRFFYEKFI